MGALIFMIPVLALDVWLMSTTGRKQFQIWARARSWPRLAGVVAIGVALGVWLAFFVEYKWGDKMKVIGFPIPNCFFHLEDGHWVDFIPPTPIACAGAAVNFLSGLAAPLLPFKFAEFLRAVKAEL